MKPFIDKFICFIDPVSLGVAGLLAGAGAGSAAAASSMAGGGNGQTPDAPVAPPPVQSVAQSPTGTKPQNKSQTPTFIGASALPNQGGGGMGKTLLGQ
jgi:hypothetical protein